MHQSKIAVLCARFAFVALSLSVVSQPLFAAQENVGITELGPNLLLFATTSGNVIASIGPDGALLVGTPSIASTPQISKILDARTKSPIRYVVIAESQHSQFDGDAGWGARGAFVAMQEKGLERLGGHAMGAPKPLEPRFTQLAVDRPRVAFSEVLTFDINGDAIHFIHQPPGYCDADILVHFHTANLVYMGYVFPGDGYPDLEPRFGAQLSGLLQTLNHWTNDHIRVVPARGKVATGADVKAFRDMLVTVSDRIQIVVKAGGTEQDALDTRPTAEFDDKWGHGTVNPEAFVRSVYNALKTP